VFRYKFTTVDNEWRMIWSINPNNGRFPSSTRRAVKSVQIVRRSSYNERFGFFHLSLLSPGGIDRDGGVFGPSRFSRANHPCGATDTPARPVTEACAWSIGARGPTANDPRIPFDDVDRGSDNSSWTPHSVHDQVARPVPFDRVSGFRPRNVIPDVLTRLLEHQTFPASWASYRADTYPHPSRRSRFTHVPRTNSVPTF